MHVRVASSRQPWKLKRVYERVGDRSSRVLKELHKQKVIQFRVSGAFVPRAFTSSISYLGGQPTSLQGTNKAFGLNYKGSKIPKN